MSMHFTTINKHPLWKHKIKQDKEIVNISTFLKSIYKYVCQKELNSGKISLH